MYALLLILSYVLPPECSEEEELGEERDDLAQEFLPSPPSSPPPAGLSLLALSVSIDSAHLSMVLSVDEVSEH